MKRSPTRTLPRLLPLTATAAAVLLSVCVTPGTSEGRQSAENIPPDKVHHAKEAAKRRIPSPRLEVRRVEGTAPDVIDVEARCLTGKGRYEWHLRGWVVGEDGKPAPAAVVAEVGQGPKSVSVRRGSLALGRPYAYEVSTAEYQWRFRRSGGKPERLTFVVEAVAVPVPAGKKFPPGVSMSSGAEGTTAHDATAAELAAARRQPGARFLRRELRLAPVKGAQKPR
jgi:hypothetical protein